MPTGASLFSAYASFCATYTLLQQAFYQFVPASVRYYFYKLFMRWFGEISKPQPDIFSLIIPEKNDMNRNEVFAACQIYLCSKMNDSADCLEVSKATNEDTMSYKLVTGVTFFDTFEGVGLTWTLNSTSSNEDDGGDSSDHNKVQKRPSHSPVIGNMYFSLSFDKKHKKKICDSYLPFVISTSQDITREGRVLRIYDCASVYGYGSRHSSVKMTHPFTFEKLAIDPEMKKMIMDDLDRFVKRRDFYKRVGKPWKRGYLLYGPPGTGKSSLIAAMANHLRFDIYDVQLGSMLGRYYALRDLLLWLPSRSIVIIEDIDRTQGLPKNRTKAPPEDIDSDSSHDIEDEKNKDQNDLASLLNFVDGLWSCCGDERIIVLTTNHKEKLDPALLRPGRMDMHIHMSYLTMPGFKVLAHNYLQISHDHALFPEIERLLKMVNATPAEVAEELMRSEDANIALQGVIEMLNGKVPKAEVAAPLDA
ncbi:unnamed protein product [Cuscuta campestris]|nr:unnamed protein product [Cuscuta campestris]